MTTVDIENRARGALYGLAIGDALGMPTQALPREVITQRYGHISSFVDAPEDQPIAPSMPAGSVTDDTEQAILVGELLLAGQGHIDPQDFALALMEWERTMIERGSRDLLGPSTKAALVALQAGASTSESGKYGTTNGSAMRIAPVGIAYPLGGGLMDAVVEACCVTHNTGLGISGAAAIATGVSAGIDGLGASDMDEVLERMVSAAGEGERLGNWVAGGSIPQRFVNLRSFTKHLSQQGFCDYLYDVVGTSVQSQESVVSAMLIIDRFRDAPFDALCTAASLGGDTDTIGAMAGAVLGATHGMAAFPDDIVNTINDVNSLEIDLLAERLIALRS